MTTKPPRFIPENSRPVTAEGVDAILYHSERDGKFISIGYVGKSSKHTFYYGFKSSEQRDLHTADFFERIKNHQEAQEKRKAERKAFRHSLKIGDILHSSWGYEQTNVEFYQIIAVTEKTVTFREVCQNRTRTGHDQGVCSPILNEFVKDSKEYTRPVRPDSNGKGFVKFSRYTGAYMKHLWYSDQKEHYFSDGY